MIYKITSETSPQTLWDFISKLREQKGKEKQTLRVIDQAIKVGHAFIVNLFFEEALVYQHMVMAEGSKDTEKKDKNKQVRALAKMEEAIKKAEFYVRKYRLKVWESRLHRFLGRLYDYEGLFEKSVVEYKKAIPLAKLDPDYTEKGYPRWMELKGFLAYSLLMSGQVQDGVRLAKDSYQELKESRDAMYLMKKDYFTWAVWLSGIPIRTIAALIEKRMTFNRREMLNWLSEAGRLLVIPKGEKTWGDKNFQFRKDEIVALKRRLRQN